MDSTGGSFKIIIIGLMILSGAINTIAYKFQNKQIVYEGPFIKYFFHPYMQAVTMFFGEASALVIFYVLKYRDPEGHKTRIQKARSEGKQTKVNKFLLFIPALGDFITSTLQYTALNFIPGSVYQMMRGGSIVTTFVFSIIFLNAKILRHQIIGSGLALFGITIVGFSNLYFSQSGGDNTSAGLQLMGYVLIIASLFSNGFYFVFEQKLLDKYHLEPLEIVGWEGVFGLCLYAITLPIITYIPCTFGTQACVFTQNGYPFLENGLQYFRELGQSGVLLFFCILGIFSILTFNITGVAVTKYINALARSIADVTRTVLVWLISIIITLTAGSKYPNYKWQIVGAGAILVELVGFIVLVSGNIIYNKIIKIPYIHINETENPLSQLETGEDLTISLQQRAEQD